ncbi:hypothetical protein [Mycoavidus sp. B2-EB]|uniref:hypothetical protein n=1 Tax=Mycoavidus sp. B2-EB TaxID=2651972 RepID=UPI00162434A6|nr:hypothetical protein [Mycoavidus sp. B2-EB]BBO59087.1 hypothetical protein MPB2EB_0188 [Mycoavidus sp. B2-EB]
MKSCIFVMMAVLTVVACGGGDGGPSENNVSSRHVNTSSVAAGGGNSRPSENGVSSDHANIDTSSIETASGDGSRSVPVDGAEIVLENSTSTEVSAAAGSKSKRKRSIRDPHAKFEDIHYRSVFEKLFDFEGSHVTDRETLSLIEIASILGGAYRENGKNKAEKKDVKELVQDYIDENEKILKENPDALKVRKIILEKIVSKEIYLEEALKKRFLGKLSQPGENAGQDVVNKYLQDEAKAINTAFNYGMILLGVYASTYALNYHPEGLPQKGIQIPEKNFEIRGASISDEVSVNRLMVSVWRSKESHSSNSAQIQGVRYYSDNDQNFPSKNKGNQEGWYSFSSNDPDGEPKYLEGVKRGEIASWLNEPSNRVTDFMYFD